MKNTRRIAAVISAAAMTVSMFGMTASAEGSAETTIRQMIGSMTTEQKIEQMMMITLRPWSDGTEGSEPVNVTTLNEAQRDFIEKHNFAGVCLYAPNLHDTAQCLELTDEIQQAALRSECGIPMLIAADQEGGRIYRLTTGTPTSGNMALGATTDPALACENAKILGSELSAIGINTDFAPVIDVNNNPSNPVINLRSFSSDPQLVGEMSVEYIKGLQSEGVVTTVKHFPGHGDTGTDSHTGLPLIDKTYDELKETELFPYTAAVQAGADMVMTAHIQFPQIEPERYTSISTQEEITIPATLSRTMITDVLRGDYQFDGVVITDSMIMNAIMMHFDPLDAAVLAMNADVDIILEPLVVTNPAEMEEMEQYITDVAQLVEEGKISVSTIDKSVERILTMKQERGILDYQKPDPEKAMQTVGSAEHREQALQIAERGVTLVKNEADTLPLKLGANGRIAYFYAYDNVKNTMTFALDRLKKEGVIAEGVTAECNCFKGHKAAEYEELIRNSDAVILALEMYNTGTLDPQNETRGWQAAFADELIPLAHKLGKKVVYVSAHIPYDVARFTDADAILATYCANGMEALPVDGQENQAYGVNYPAALITALGGNVPTGKLPVDIYEIENYNQYTDTILYPFGYGLTYEKPQDAQEETTPADQQETDPEEPEKPTDALPDESAYFAPGSQIIAFAKKEYAKRTGKEPADTELTVDTETMTAVVELLSDMHTPMDHYKIDLRTGIGTDSSGNTIDLSVYVQPEKTFFAPVEKLGEMAKIDYEKKTGTACYAAGSVLNDAGTEVTIRLTDADGTLLDTYVIDPYTGKGRAAAGTAVDLPQTGTTSPKTAATAAGGLLMLAAGLFTMHKSGILRRKKRGSGKI